MQIIIVNADDFGSNHHVNKAIEALIKEDVVTSSTIMSNGEAFEEAVVIAKKYENVSFGVHLCIDEYSPLIPSDVYKKHRMVDENGHFINFSYIGVGKNEELSNTIYLEWKAQIKKLQDAGIPVSHLDSHHHAHCYSFLTPIYIRLANEFGIPYVRIAKYTPLCIKLKEKKNPITLGSTSHNGNTKRNSIVKRKLQVIKNNLELFNTNNIIKRKFHTTDFFCSGRYYLTNKDLLKRYHTIELMVHPGHPSYQQETEQLKEIKNMNDVVLKNYFNFIANEHNKE